MAVACPRLNQVVVWFEPSTGLLFLRVSALRFFFHLFYLHQDDREALSMIVKLPWPQTGPWDPLMGPHHPILLTQADTWTMVLQIVWRMSWISSLLTSNAIDMTRFTLRSNGSGMHMSHIDRVSIVSLRPPSMLLCAQSKQNPLQYFKNLGSTLCWALTIRSYYFHSSHPLKDLSIYQNYVSRVLYFAATSF